MTKKKLVVIGWQEWCALPDLHLPAIKAKVDTGAKTSAIHAENIKKVIRKGIECVQFTVYPLQQNKRIKVRCTVPIHDERNVMSSSGHRELRFFIKVDMQLGEETWPIEISLSSRDPLKFRMLLGREALKHHVMVDPGRILCLGKLSSGKLKNIYKWNEKK